MHRALILTLIAGLAVSRPLHADDAVPAFDRPGIGLGTGIVPRAALAVELGLPDYARDRDRDGLRSEDVDSAVTLRTGLARQWELQLSGTPWQRQRQRAPGAASLRSRGSGDTQMAVKWSPSSSDASDRWAVLASATVARGDPAFSEGRQYALAGSYEHDFSDRWTGALYASHSEGGGARATTWSPSLSLALGERWSAFLEAGFSKARGKPRESIAGAGLTWMWTDHVQLDASVDAGLDADSPDLQAGLGISAYFN